MLSVGTAKIPLEVKYQRRIDPPRDTEGLRTFIVSLPLSSLLLLR